MIRSITGKILRTAAFLFFDFRGGRRLNICKTLYYNFRLFPFKIAVRFPLFIHCGVKTYKMGKIIIEGKVKNGMLRIGGFNMKSQSGISRILNRGVIIVRGNLILGGATIIENAGEMVFEGETVAGEGTSFLIHKRIVIGQYTRIGFNCLFTDTDYHYMVNVNTGDVKQNKNEINVGRCCWIGSHASLKKGVVLPSYTIVASNSLLTKDYTTIIPPYGILGGAPAKLIAVGYRRIYNMTEEKRLNKYFNHNNEQTYAINLENTDLETLCTQDALKFE
ncbi:MAG: hypothetical protein LBH04_12290 [Tannerellaceae bacterium]|nr:hypothetical protein [Tannerellaceae bacterium]